MTWLDILEFWYFMFKIFVAVGGLLGMIILIITVGKLIFTKS